MVFDSTAQKHNRKRCHEKGKMSILEQTAKYGVIDRDGEKVSFTREGFTREINAYINDKGPRNTKPENILSLFGVLESRGRPAVGYM